MDPAGFEMSFDEFYNHVALFNRTFKSKNDPNLRLALLVEEASEAWKAQVKSLPLEDLEGELGDALYVLFGWYLVAGIDPGRSMKRVALKNQEKINNRDKMVVSETGKILKPGDGDRSVLSLPEVKKAIADMADAAVTMDAQRMIEQAKEFNEKYSEGG
jgi:NTP pyrophosphatase (non-canonical NTP hydrolase)